MLDTEKTNFYMTEGAKAIADLFNLETNSTEHKQMCAALLPTFMESCDHIDRSLDDNAILAAQGLRRVV